MTSHDLISALGLPAAAHIDQRVPKKLLVENGAPTAADRRLVTDGAEEIRWVAALKPATVGVAPYEDDVRAYVEIAVMTLALREGAKAGRLVELLHRAIPYPVMLVAGQEGGPLSLSLAHKRWSQGEADKTVLDGDLVEADVESGLDPAIQRAFLNALPLARQPRGTFVDLYDGWMHTLIALQAARVTGTFGAATTAEHAAARRQALEACERLEGEMARLRASAKREKQMARKVALNLELKRLQADYAAARAHL